MYSRSTRVDRHSQPYCGTGRERRHSHREWIVPQHGLKAVTGTASAPLRLLADMLDLPARSLGDIAAVSRIVPVAELTASLVRSAALLTASLALSR